MTLKCRSMSSSSAAVIGGGIGGMVCGYQLAKLGWQVHVFDMGSRGPGGRASTRQVLDTGYQFDHGCQFFILPEPSTMAAGSQSALDHLLETGVVAEWRGRFGVLDAQQGFVADHFTAGGGDFCGFLQACAAGRPVHVAVPGMAAVCHALAQTEGLTGYWNSKVTKVDRSADDKWQVWAQSSTNLLAGAQSFVSYVPDTPVNSSAAANATLHKDVNGVHSAGSRQFPLEPTDATDVAQSQEGAGAMEQGLTAGEAVAAGAVQAGVPQTEIGRPTPAAITSNLVASRHYEALIIADAMTVHEGSPGYVEYPEALDTLCSLIKAVQPVVLYSLMVVLPLSSAPFDAAVVQGSEHFQWLACDSSKPGRPHVPGHTCWVAVTTNSFAQNLLELQPLMQAGRPHDFKAANFQAAIAPVMWQPLKELLVQHQLLPGETEPVHRQVQRWGRALHSAGLPTSHQHALPMGVACAGDFVSGRFAAEALQSGIAVAERLQAARLQGRGNAR